MGFLFLQLYAAAVDLSLLRFPHTHAHIHSRRSDNQWWTSSFATTQGFATASGWASWQADSENVGGYITRYTPTGGTAGSFAFTTVRGAGHMVPQVRIRHGWHGQ